ncbi:phage tail tube protein [Azospirillum tabaci]|uniref:phage tail tube protein n=1 Tax=Azospirillum tabaci TaxID=2752310 RepID=UPI00166150E1|nr:phage tail tube protein [Azospirillum tabaci]
MTSSNRVRLTGVAEATYGVTPTTPRMRKQRVTSIGLARKADYVDSDDLRDDRQNSDPTMVGESNNGSIGIEWHYPADGSLLSSEIESAFCNPWVNTPARDNDGVLASVIQGITAATQVVAVAAGAPFVAGQLVYFTGFGQSANRGKLAKVTTGSATAPAFQGAGLVDEASPAAAARMKVVGFEGAAGDLKAVADGLTSEAAGLDFTTLGLTIGGWLKIGDTAAANRFDTAGTNVYGRIVGISARKLTLDNLPASWATDTGNGKQIRVFVSDVIVNGVQKRGITFERGFLGQATPTYITQTGNRVNTLEFGGSAKQKAVGSIAFLGLKGTKSPVSLDDTPDEAPDSAAFPAFAFSANCGRIGEGGQALAKPNFAKAVKYTINNNLRPIEACSNGDDTAPAAVDIEDGAFDVAVELDIFFGNGDVLDKVMAGTATSLNTRLEKGGKAMIWEAPRLTPREGDPNVSGKNQDVMLPVRLTASKDPLTGVQLILSRFELVR